MSNYHQNKFSSAFNTRAIDTSTEKTLTTAQKTQLDMLESLLDKLSSPEREFGIEVNNLNLAVGMSSDSHVGFVHFTVHDEGIEFLARPGQIFSGSTVGSEADLIGALGGEMNKAVHRTTYTVACAEYLGNKPLKP